ncbi:MAG TPA: hypothetical protein VEP90_09270 [Methylomirabilota bacterium]|nr:hypothetical protein [Methylomirabilota bacterium]
MSSLDILKRKIKELEERAVAIEYQVTELIEGVTLSVEGYGASDEYYEIISWLPLTSEQREARRKALRDYEGWYSAAYQLIKDYLPERSDDFCQYYEYQKGKSSKQGVIDYLQFKGDPGTNSNSVVIDRILDAFERQLNILVSVQDVLDIKELNLRKLISADVVKIEIDQAEALFASGFYRAAGVVAGVALERYLKTLCDINKISYSSRDTIQPVAQLLRSAGKLEIVEMNRITYLASIRNKCSHPDGASNDEIKSLIDEVKKLI